MVEDLEQGDVAETIKTFFDQSKHIKPQKKSNLTIQQVYYRHKLIFFIFFSLSAFYSSI